MGSPTGGNLSVGTLAGQDNNEIPSGTSNQRHPSQAEVLRLILATWTSLLSTEAWRIDIRNSGIEVKEIQRSNQDALNEDSPESFRWAMLDFRPYRESVSSSTSESGFISSAESGFISSLI